MTEQYWRFDENNLFTENGDKHDWCEKAYMAYQAYGMKKNAHDMIGCVINPKGEPRRYPLGYPGMRPMSRDHIIYLSVVLSKEFPLLTFYKGLEMPKGWENRGFWMNPSLWLWLRKCYDRPIGWLWYPLEWVMSYVNVTWDRIINKFTLLMEEFDQRDFISILADPSLSQKDRDDAQKTVKWLFPIYAIKLIATQVYHSDKNWFTRQISKNYLKIVPKGNLALRALFGDRSLTEKEFNDYLPMTGSRWATLLNPYYDNRNLRILGSEETQVFKLDKDYLLSIWQED